MGRGGVKTFDGLVDAVGDSSTVDGNSPGLVSRSLSRSVALRDLIGNPYNPRDSIGNIDELASIVDFQLQPVVVVTRSVFQNLYPEARISGRWVVIIGNRRLAAAQKFGRPDLDIVVKDELAKDRATLLTAIIAENVDRSGFDVIEEAKAVESLVGEYGSADAAADHLRKSKTWVSHRRALLKLAPELQEATRRGDLAIREARSLARVPLEQQVVRWNAASDRRNDCDSDESQPNEQPSSRRDGSAVSGPQGARSVARALKKFDVDPNGLAVVLREQLGDIGSKTLISHMRKLLKPA